MYTVKNKHNFSFCYADWGKDQEDESDKKSWEDNWDDDNVEDDFSQQLRYVWALHTLFDVTPFKLYYSELVIRQEIKWAAVNNVCS